MYSGVLTLASPTDGVSVFAGCDFRVSPMKPKWIGRPTISQGLPSTMIGRMRLVTQALALMAPRWLEISTQSPCLMPLALASRSPISTNISGCRTALSWTFLVQ